MKNRKTTVTSINIVGIDRSTPNNTVVDGSCEELHNLRYHAGAWRSVNQQKTLHRISRGDKEIQIKYSHPATAENMYIARDLDGNYWEIEIFDDGTYEYSFKFEMAKGLEKVAHFGNMLIFYKNGETVYYSFTSDNQNRYSLTMNNIGDMIDISCDYNGGEGKIYSDPKLNPGEAQVIKLYEEQAGENKYASAVRIADDAGNPMFPTGDDDQWHGEVMCFASLRAEDGSEIDRTLPIFLSSGIDTKSWDYYSKTVIAWDKNTGAYVERYARILQQGNSETQEHYFGCYTRGVPQLRVFLYNIEKYAPIKSVRIYSTRVLPIFDCKKIRTKLNKQEYKFIGDFREVFSYNDWGAEPFYLAKEIELNDFEDYDWKKDQADEDGNVDHRIVNYHENDTVKYCEIALTWSECLENIESKGVVYEPQVNSIFSFSTFFEYNNRAHASGITNVIRGGEKNGYPADKLIATYSLDGNALNRKEDYRFYLPISSEYEKNSYKSNPKKGVAVIAIGNSSATTLDGYGELIRNYGANFSLFMKRQDKTTSVLDVEYYEYLPSPIEEHNFTSRLVAHCDDKYIHFNSTQHDLDGYKEFFYHDSNRLQVSEPNNPQYFLFDKSYQIGTKSNRILTMNSVAMEISDNKTGEFPLFAFTEEGIFALHLSDQLLYNPITAVNFDRVISENTVAANGVVAYFTIEGLHLIGPQTNSLISLPLNSSRGNSFIGSGETLFWNKVYNELIMLSRDGEIFAYSLEHGYWSTRKITAENAQCAKINNEIVAIENEAEITLLSMQEDHDIKEPIHVILDTRPIKLGSMEYKRIETLIIRMVSDPYNVPVKISVFGSNDAANWTLLRSGEVETSSDIRVRHMQGSSRLIKIRLETTISEEGQISMLGFIAEYFHRFVNKVR
uniref:hypothetical protein n=1 Tax=Alistipes sp. TaxID=1872444 RepID=UPI0040562A7E